LDLAGKVAESANVIEIFLSANVHLYFGYQENAEFDADFDEKK
jgi:hypothetical protein